MAQARGIATMAMATLLLLSGLQFEIGFAANYTVGDDGGWSFGVSNWTKGKSFKVGDILEFNYSPQQHNVVVVDEKGYETCTFGGDAKKFNSGHDQIQITGKTFFICGFPGHCDSQNMKLAISV